jgi:hypothetical protein
MSVALDGSRTAARDRRHPQQPGDHRDVGDRVEPEAAGLADGREQHARHGGTEHARGVERGGVERDRVRQVLLPHHLDQERLARGQVERVDRAEQEGEHQHHPRRHDPGADDRRERGGLEQHERLGGQDQPALVDAVHDHARREREERDRHELAEAEQPEHERRGGEPVHEPALRHALHPCADHRDQLAGPEQAEIAVAERSKLGRERFAQGADAMRGRYHARRATVTDSPARS